MMKLMKRNYRRLVAMLLTTAMILVNAGSNMAVAFAADNTTDNLFLISGEDLNEAIEQAKEEDERFDYSSLNLTADKSVKKTYQKLLKGNVYQLDVPVDDAYAGEYASVDVFYNADMEAVVFLYINAGVYKESFAVNIDGYETKSIEVKAFDEAEEAEDTDTEVEDAAETTDAAEEESEIVEEVEAGVESEATEEPEEDEAAETTEAETDAVDDLVEEDAGESESEQIVAAISVHKVDLVGSNVEAAGEESAEAETEEVETTEAETDEVETTEVETSEAETTEAETSEAETIEEETTAAETTEAETTAAETTEEETTEAETAESKPAESDRIEEPTTENNSDQPDQPEADDMEGQLLLDDDYEVLGTIDGKEYPVVTIWEDASARACSVKLVDLPDTLDLIAEEEDAFDESYVASNDVVIHVSAKAGVLPQGTTLEVKEITGEVASSVKEKMEEDGGAVEVLAYDIMLMLDGEVLPNDWSEAGSGVTVTFRGKGIREKAKTATAVQVLHADTLDGSPVEEASADQLSLDDEGREMIYVADEKMEEVSFDAEHFSVYIIAFVNENAETVGNLRVVQTVTGTAVGENENPAGEIPVDGGKEWNVADLVYDNALSGYVAGEGTTSFAYATAVPDETAERIAKVRVENGKVQHLSGADWVDFDADAVMYLWYTDQVAQIGDMQYATLNEAIHAVDGTSEIVLLADAEITVNAITKPVTILGEGHIVSIPRQPSTDSGGLEIRDALSFKNTKVRFKEDANARQWSVTLSSTAKLNILEHSECVFEQTGIYSSSNAEINIEQSSSMTLENMRYTCIMGEAYPYLNIKDDSVLTIKEPLDINGITGFKITVDASKLSITDCANQGIVMSDLVLLNGATADVSNNDTGYNLFGGN